MYKKICTISKNTFVQVINVIWERLFCLFRKFAFAAYIWGQLKWCVNPLSAAVDQTAEIIH